MKKILYLISLTVVFTSCHNDDVDTNAPNFKTLSHEETQIVTGSNAFAFDLFREVQQAEVDNVFISPLSVTLAIGMTLNGTEDETQLNVLRTLGFEGMQASDVNQAFEDLIGQLLSMDKKVELGIANSVWYDQDFSVNKDFSTVVQQYYDGKIQGLDFGSSTAKDVINQWAENKTNHKIKNLIDKIENNDIMFLVNTLYFKGDWKTKFSTELTHTADFTTLAGNKTQVDMMKGENVSLHHFENSKLKLLDIPYGNGQFSFTVLMPNNPADFTRFIADLSESELAGWLSQADSSEVTLQMPRFKMTWQDDLKHKLSDLGMPMENFPKLFDPTQPVEISRVIHKTFLEVNENGSEAAAATAVVITYLSAPPPSAIITIDKSFLFMIREKHTGSILFMGQLVNPATLHTD